MSLKIKATREIEIEKGDQVIIDDDDDNCAWTVTGWDKDYVFVESKLAIQRNRITEVRLTHG